MERPYFGHPCRLFLVVRYNAAMLNSLTEALLACYADHASRGVPLNPL
jgi:hypothetical protein